MLEIRILILGFTNLFKFLSRHHIMRAISGFLLYVKPSALFAVSISTLSPPIFSRRSLPIIEQSCGFLFLFHFIVRDILTFCFKQPSSAHISIVVTKSN